MRQAALAYLDGKRAPRYQHEQLHTAPLIMPLAREAISTYTPSCREQGGLQACEAKDRARHGKCKGRN
jgi:hypothetical protein